MELYIIISLFFIAGGVRVTESNDRCYVPVACLDGRKAWIDVPNEEKLPVSLLFPNYCKVDELCKKKMEETQKALDSELRTLEKQYTGVKELLEQKMKTRNRTITRPAEKPSKPGTTTTTKPSIEISSVEGDTTTESDGCGPLYNNSTSIVCRDNPTARDDRCEWTGWYNRDEPTTAEDNEELLDLRKEKPGQICEHPTCIEARVANTKQPYTETGDIVHISPCNGFQCINADQPGCPTKTRPVCCKDYEVRFRCPTDFEWKGKYFWVKIPGNKINFKGAEEECKKDNGRPANIYDAMHYENVTVYVRTQTDTKKKLWLGMTYDSKEGKTYLSNGTEAKYEKWKNDHPKRNGNKHIALEVNGSSGSEGMLFSGPEDDDKIKRDGVICEE